MARKALKLTEKKIADMIQAGRSQGEGADYQPWIQVGNFSSEGRGHRIADIHTGRIHHFFSDLEASYYYILAWADQVIDIREQYPLFPVSDTEDITQALGYRHPRAPGNAINEVMTTDFLITVQDASGTHLEARHVKYEKGLEKTKRNRKT
ncbi:TnsA endonuclease N-terminal domain-containing protein [Bengtsoniella intestinalis]|uniref:TnsA endonuclease N-terminal domain-containing protein n=1 Tax=Bengtsoniella intestinalis TaxID=3073143 RepID=UPI00391F39BE